jgi:hypothetical protein
MNTPLSVAINSQHYFMVEKLIDIDPSTMKGFIYEEPKAKG